MIDEQLFSDLSQYIFMKTGKVYFKNIKRLEDDVMITCPFHKNGQEKHPSCGVRINTDEKVAKGTVHCFTCGVTTNIVEMLKEILGSSYNEEELNTRFNLNDLIDENIDLTETVKEDLFTIPNRQNTNEKLLRNYRKYNEYLANRGISEKTATIYDIGYDEKDNCITFPIRDKYKNCKCIGKRSVLKKQYFYPAGITKPLYRSL